MAVAPPSASVSSGLLLGSGITLLVFFDRYPPHNYYQLPFAFPLAFFGAQGLEGLRVLARAGRRSLRPWRWAPLAAVPLAILASGLWSWSGVRTLGTSNAAVELIRSRGEWIGSHTRPRDYVIYVFEGAADDWNPAGSLDEPGTASNACSPSPPDRTSGARSPRPERRA